MENKEKNKRQLFQIITSLRKQVKNLLKLGPKLKKKEGAFRELEKNIESRVNLRTSAERVIKKLLHADIEQRKQLEKVAQDSLDYANGIVATVRDPLIVLDSSLDVISANHAFYRTFNVKPEDTEKQHIYNLGDHQWNIPRLRVLLEDILASAAHFDNFEVEHDFPGIGKRTMLLNARKIYRRKDQTQLILLAIEDVTERVLMENKLKTLASHDELTSCLNFRAIMELLENEIARSARYKKVFTMVMVDIDQFKNINDKYGHIAGSEILSAFAKTLKNSVRNVDIVGRYGGDEFIIVLPETDSQEALLVLERVRNSLGSLRVISSSIKNTEEPILQFSAGVAVFPRNAKNLEELLRAADGALRQAKCEGKNRAVLERRGLVRLPPVPGVKIEIVDPSGDENIKTFKIANISTNGMLLLSSQDIAGEELLCRVCCPGSEVPFDLACEVKHKSKPENDLYHIGVYFSKIPESIQEKLSNCIEFSKEAGKDGDIFLEQHAGAGL